MALQHDALVEGCSRILLSRACQKICFPWQGQVISGKGYRSVVMALLESRIQVKTGALPDDAGGLYDSKQNLLVLHPMFNPDDIFFQMTLVHEATHAIQDMQFAGHSLWRLDGEAAAYIAEQLFVLFSPPPENTSPFLTERSDPIRTRAPKIAKVIAANPMASIDQKTSQDLRDAILNTDLYTVSIVLDPWEAEDGVPASRFP